MKQIKVSEASELQLDWLASKCVGDFALYHDIEDGQRFLNLWTDSAFLHYSSNWANGGPIIEREKIGVYPVPRGVWAAFKYQEADGLARIAGVSLPIFKQYAATPLIAAVRCYVASKLGDVVEVPDELVQ